MASLFGTPSPLVEDDGTARFVRTSDAIVVAHSGVSADGREKKARGKRGARAEGRQSKTKVFYTLQVAVLCPSVRSICPLRKPGWA